MIAIAAMTPYNVANNAIDTPSGYTILNEYEDGSLDVAHQHIYKTMTAGETSAVSWTHANTSQSGWTAAIATFKGSAGGSNVTVAATGSAITSGSGTASPGISIGL
jgi:hypothetical protein